LPSWLLGLSTRLLRSSGGLRLRTRLGLRLRSRRRRHTTTGKLLQLSQHLPVLLDHLLGKLLHIFVLCPLLA
jgi:hypothetical protein